MRYSRLLGVLGFVIIIGLGIYCIVHLIQKNHSIQRITIILSPRLEDVHLALGGFISNQKNPPIIKSFLSEDEEISLDSELEMSQGIQALLASYGERELHVYGPGQGMLHNAFINVGDQYFNDNVHFYIYEDFPYIVNFNQQSVRSFEKMVEETSDVTLNRIDIPLSSREIKVFPEFKRVFAETRCGSNPPRACEVVYELTD